MSERATVDVMFHVKPLGQRTKVRERDAKPSGKAASVPRISRLMALAIRFDQLVRDGTVTDFAELARLGHVTRSRMSQIMNLLNLAPDIQEELLFWNGRGLTERTMRPIAAEVDWGRQRKMWGEVKGEFAKAE